MTLAPTKDVTKTKPTKTVIQPVDLTIDELNIENSGILLSDSYDAQQNSSMEAIAFLAVPKLSIKNIKVVNKGKDVITVDDINIEPEEYEKYLKKAFKAYSISKKIYPGKWQG